MMNAQTAQRPYTTMLSLLRKINLIRLSIELKLPTEGNIMVLKDRLRVYLNAHSETLYKNPRFQPLYPSIRRLPQAARQPALPVSNRTPSPSPSDSSESSADSFESWNGIQAELPVYHQVAPVYPAQPPVVPAEVVEQVPLDFYPPPPPPPPPSPSPSVPASDPGFPPPTDHHDGLSKYLLPFPILSLEPCRKVPPSSFSYPCSHLAAGFPQRPCMHLAAGLFCSLYIYNHARIWQLAYISITTISMLASGGWLIFHARLWRLSFFVSSYGILLILWSH